MAGFFTQMSPRSRSATPFRAKLREYWRCCTSTPSKVKVLTVDGQCLKFEGPISVKEVLMEHPNHTIFSSVAVREQGNKARPLQVSVTLKAGHLYFLIPTPQRRVSQASNHSEMPSSLHTQCGHQLKGFTEAEENINVSTPEDQPTASRTSAAIRIPASVFSKQSALKPHSMQVLPSPSDGVLRVKMLVSKRDLASLLEESRADSISVMGGPLFPSLKFEEEDQSRSSRNITKSGNLGNGWKTALESIPELASVNSQCSY